MFSKPIRNQTVIFRPFSCCRSGLKTDPDPDRQQNFDTNVPKTKLQLKQLNILRKYIYKAGHAENVSFSMAGLCHE
jgi:hypothetical protein